MTPPDPSEPPRSGRSRTIGHYQITAKLGQGGMGEVYRVTDSKLGRRQQLQAQKE